MIFLLEEKSKVLLVPIIFFNEVFEWRFEGSRWSKLIWEDEWEEYFSKGEISRCEKEVFLTGGNVFSENGPQWDLFFGLKEKQEFTLNASAEVSREEVTFFKDKSFKEGDEFFLKKETE